MILNRCIVCNNVIKSGQYLCEECNEKFKLDEFDSFIQRCDKCGFPLLDRVYNCRHCSEFPGFKVYPICDYDLQFAKRILENYKFAGEKRLRFFIANVFAETISKLGIDNPVIIPIPSSSKSKMKRGWDQMKEVAKVLHYKYGYSVSFCLKSYKDYQYEQKTLNKKQRSETAAKKYYLSHNLSILQNRPIILIDDICTTGSTLACARSVLVNAGFKDAVAVTMFAVL